MQQSKPTCSHTKFLSKQSVKNLVANQPTKTCALHTDLPFYYICLHCGSSICLQYQGSLSCLQYHHSTASHFFFFQIEHGSIWCQLCKDTIQNQLFDYGPEDKNDSVLRLRRFEKCISDAWSQIAVKSHIEIGGVPHRGIKNLGNTCYLNAVLQSLFASLSLQELYAKIETKQDKIFLGGKIVAKQIQYFYDDVLIKHQSTKWNIVTSKKQKSKQQSKKTYSKPVKNARFNIVFKQFMNQMKGKEKQLAPREILSILGEYNSKYREKAEQDAEQLLLLIIDLLSQGERINLLRDLQRYKEVENILGFQKLTPTQSIFSFYLFNQVQCNQCKQTSHSLNLAYNLPLSLGQPKIQTYQMQHKVSTINIDYWQELIYPQSHHSSSFLSSFFKMQRLNKAQNYYQCNKCSSILAFRRYFIVSQPKILIASIKRFDAKLQKKSGYVEFPEELSLEGLSLDKKPGKYQLYAIIIHEGSTIASGHYTCIIKLNNQWLLCSDQNIQRISWKSVKTQQPYVLFYHRLPQE